MTTQVMTVGECMTGESLPTQRGAPKTSTLVGAGEIVLRPGTPIASETVDVVRIPLQPEASDHLDGSTPGGDVGPPTGPADTDQSPEIPEASFAMPEDETDVTEPDSRGTDRFLREKTVTRQEGWGLVERIQQGDDDAFGELYKKYLDTVFRFVYFRTTNRTVAEDLTSETFLRALGRIDRVEWRGRDIGAWLITIARNLVADHFKSGHYRLELPTGDVLDAEKTEINREGNPEQAVLDYIANKTLLSAVLTLNSEQRQCIVFRFLLGFSVAETAAAMGKNGNSIKALQYRAVRGLQRLLPEGFLDSL